jgi:Fe-S cluster assembly protein SufD
MNLAGLDDGVVLQIAEGTRIERPIEILHLSLGLDGPSISQPRLVVRLEKDASATLIERYAAFGQSIYFNNVVVDIETLRGARLSHIRIQTESNQAYQVANQSVRQAENSHYSLRSMVAGGAWSRLNIDHRLSGQEASADLKGLYLINGKRFTDLHLKLSHQVPACQSSEDFRGILNGAGRAVFDGNIVVERDAQKTDARLSNDNLMLSRAAEVDTKPQLEIYADDVKCSHGTTVGELDHDSLFYLRSRGIGVDQAKRILCRGFARDLFDDVESPALLHYLIEQIDRRLTEPEEP